MIEPSWKDILGAIPRTQSTEPSPSGGAEPADQSARAPQTEPELFAARVRAIDAEFMAAVPRIPAEYVASLSNSIAHLKFLAAGPHGEEVAARMADVVEQRIRELDWLGRQP